MESSGSHSSSDSESVELSNTTSKSVNPFVPKSNFQSSPESISNVSADESISQISRIKSKRKFFQELLSDDSDSESTSESSIVEQVKKAISSLDQVKQMGEKWGGGWVKGRGDLSQIKRGGRGSENFHKTTYLVK